MTLSRRMTITAGVAVILVSTVLYPLFDGSVWYFSGIAAVITVGAAGTLSRIRTLPAALCLAITLAALVLYLNLAFEAGYSIAAFIPTPRSMAALWDLARTGLNQTRKYAAPAPELPSLILLATGGIGITAAFTDLIAVRMKSAALAGLPLLVLFTVPVTMGAPRSSIGTAIIFSLGTAGYLAMLSADGRERIRVWGRLVSLWRSGRHDSQDLPAFGASTAPAPVPGKALGSGPRRRILGGPDTRSLAAAGRRVGFASVVLALSVPLLFPGLRATKLTGGSLGLGGSQGDGGVILTDPLGATASDLKDNRAGVVLTYSTNAPATLQNNNPQYLQEYVYDTLSDGGWQLLPRQTNFQPLSTEISAAPGVEPPDGPSSREYETTITYTSDAQSSEAQISFLALPYPATRISVSGTWHIQPSTLMVESTDTSLNGLSYSVLSHDVNPTPAELSAVPPGQPESADLQLPTSYQTSALEHLVERITAGATTKFDSATDLVNFLSSSPFSYSTTPAAFTTAAGLLSFLTKTRTGDCVHYAYAMTVLARLAGIPARLATGYTAGTLTSANHYVVKQSDAHAWPELYFAGYGWIRFEPTPPGQGSAKAPGYAQPARTNAGAVPPITGVVPSSSATAGPGKGGKAPHQVTGPDGQANPVGPAAKSHGGTPWAAVALAVALAIGLACAAFAIAVPRALRALSGRTAAGLMPDGPGAARRGRPGAATVLGAIAIAAVAALALYRLISRTSGFKLGEGWVTIGIAFGAAAGFMLIAPTAGRLLLRRWRWLRADDDAARAHAAWLELTADLADFGVGHLPSESPRALAGRVCGGLALAEPAAEAVSRIALAEERATYAASPSESESLRQDSRAARRGIAASAGRRSRLRALVFPASVLTAIAGTGARLTQAWAGRPRLRWNSER